uniref:Ribonuclease Z n=1 Tax=Ptilothamnion sphaericum TaxID=1498216 RepID=A0A4D6WXG4_9FLOR|nr:ribonuclease Z [Ptilothamnion sphaericum]QCI08338.1 ribonuclease Z [Ptilothamnion sphaericum]
MRIIYVKKHGTHTNSSFIFKLNHCRDIILFNCSESLQSYIVIKQMRINHISRIIITNLDISNLSGLLGLLSSLNLIGRVKDLHIYGPKGLSSYIDLCKKYSHTNFKYMVYVHVLTNGLIINHNQYRIYMFISIDYFDFFMVASEISGKFLIQQANQQNLFPGPLYSQLKKGFTFILPDGLILDGFKFTSINNQGCQFSFILNSYYSRKLKEKLGESTILLYK